MRGLALALAIAATVAACGDASPNAVKGAVGATREAGTARTSFRHDLVYPGEAPETLASGQGVLDFRTGRGATRASVPFVGALLGGEGSEATLAVEIVYTRAAVYARLPIADRRKPWRRFDRKTSVLPDDPTDGLALLGGADRRVLELGREEVRGVATAHYRVELDAHAIARRSPAAVRAAIEEDGRRDVPVDVWIDGEGLIRRLRWEQRYRVGDRDVRVVATTEYFDFGTRVAIDVPAPDQVSS